MQLRAHEYLDRLGISYEKCEFPGDTEKGAANVARALGFEEAQMVKTLLFETGDGERVQVLVGGDKSALMGYDLLGVGAGVWGHEIILAPGDLVRACGAIVANLTDRERPVTSSSMGAR